MNWMKQHDFFLSGMALLWLLAVGQLCQFTCSLKLNSFVSESHWFHWCEQILVQKFAVSMLWTATLAATPDAASSYYISGSWMAITHVNVLRIQAFIKCITGRSLGVERFHKWQRSALQQSMLLRQYCCKISSTPVAALRAMLIDSNPVVKWGGNLAPSLI